MCIRDSVSKAKNDMIGIEHLTESEVEEFRSRCEIMAKEADQRLEDIREKANKAA